MAKKDDDEFDEFFYMPNFTEEDKARIKKMRARLKGTGIDPRRTIFTQRYALNVYALRRRRFGKVV
jgi:hypothetical protein